jgi:hypothetical protein
MKPPKLLLASCCAGWLGLVIAGFLRLWGISIEPGPVSSFPVNWPTSSKLTRSYHRGTLIAFLHCRCSCSIATLAELEALTTEHAIPEEIRLVFEPAGLGDVKSSRLWQQAGRIPGAVCFIDGDGSEMRLFGARTSGQMLEFDPHGRLRFSGGLTPARGQRGKNTGSEVLLTLDDSRMQPRMTSHVFGCPLKGDGP